MKGLRAALAVPLAPGDDERLTLSWELAVRERLVECLRLLGDTAGALVEREGLEQTLAVFRTHADDKLEEGERELLISAPLAGVRLDLDLGRYELASRALLGLRAEVGGNAMPGRLLVTLRQLYLLSGSYRLVTEPGELSGDAAVDAALERQSLLARLLLARERLRTAESPSSPSLAAFQEALEFGEDAARSATDRRRVLAFAVPLALDIGRLDLAEQALVAARRAHLESGDTETLAAVLFEMVEAEVGLASGVEERIQSSIEDLRSAWGHLRDQVRATPFLPGGVGAFAGPARRDLLARTLDALRTHEGPDAAFDVLLEARSLSSVARELAPDRVDAEPLQAWLAGRKAGCLDWILGAGSLRACALDGRGVRWFDLGSDADLIAGSQELDRLLQAEQSGAGDPDGVRRLAAELGARFVSPELADWIEPWEHLFAVGLNGLADVQLEALHIGDRGPMGLIWPVERVASVEVARALDRRGSRVEDEAFRAVTLSATDLAVDLGSLGEFAAIESSLELERALGVSFATEDRLLSGERARLSLADEASPTLLTVLAHGVFDPRRLLPTGLLLAGSAEEGTEIAWWEDLRSIRGPRVAVLLSCRGADGFERVGDGGYGRLPTALLLAGSEAVLAGQQDLNARNAVLLHERFLHELEGGESVGRALVDARRWFAREEPSSAELAASMLQVHGLGWSPGPSRAEDADR